MIKTNKILYSTLFALASFTLVSITACSDSTSSDTDELSAMIEEVRSATNAYFNFDNAQSAGWAVDLSGCVEHPEEGGMGHHFGRPEYIDGRINHLQPQILLYEPLENGGFEFVGVEYIIPFDILPADATPPEVLGQQFHQNPGLGIWALHVWTEKENPNGMFYDWNPNVSCQYALTEVDIMLEEVRNVTESFHDADTAMAAGWDNVMSPCVEHPEEGGMGYHYGRMDYFDGRINHTEPQVLLYEPLENGGLEFVGVEYIIPFEIHPADAEPPVLFGEEYHQNHELGIWALHVWTEKENPNGVFYDWNPSVSCQFADDE